MPLLLMVLRDFCILVLTVNFISDVGIDEGLARQVCGQQGGNPMILEKSRD